MPRIANIGRKSAASASSTSISTGSRPYRWTWTRSRSDATTRLRSMRIWKSAAAALAARQDQVGVRQLVRRRAARRCGGHEQARRRPADAQLMAR